MQIKSSDGAMTVDYYQVKDFLGDIKSNVRLRVLTFVTETVNKKLIHVNDMADELFDRLDNYNYAVVMTDICDYEMMTVECFLSDLELA